MRLLAGAAAAPDRAIGSLDILEARERRRLLEDWNATSRAVPAATLPALFSGQAVRTPDAAAVVYGDRALSYAALEAQSNRLAHHLRRLGAGPERVVGLFIERSLEMVIGLIGILNGRAPLLCELGTGVLRVDSTDGMKELYVDGGFAQVLNNDVTVLTERAAAAENIRTADAQKALQEAQAMPAHDEAAVTARQRAIDRAKAQIKIATQ